MQYIEKLEEVEKKFGELEQQMADPAVIGDASAYRRVSKQRSELEELVGKYGQWKNASRNYEQAKVMMNDADADVRFMASEEIAVLEPELQTLEEDLRVLLLPKDPNDAKDVIIQVRAGAGGDEASLFAAEVFRMYVRYAETRGWKVEVTDQSDSEAGGVKEIDAIISGDKVYSRLKHEGGVHRVQRVPATETQGRIHTSTITVAVLPEADEVEVQIEAKDIRIDTFCSSGPGGQSVNTTYSAVRITHLPTNTAARPALAAVRARDGKAAGRHRSRPAQPGRHRRPQREDPHLQFQGQSRDGPPHRLDAASARPGDARPAGSVARCLDDGLQRPEDGREQRLVKQLRRHDDGSAAPAGGGGTLQRRCRRSAADCRGAVRACPGQGSRLSLRSQHGQMSGGDGRGLSVAGPAAGAR
jgi:peptide chain release factor 1